MKTVTHKDCVSAVYPTARTHQAAAANNFKLRKQLKECLACRHYPEKLCH